jgi:hypothetical protein
LLDLYLAYLEPVEINDMTTTTADIVNPFFVAFPIDSGITDFKVFTEFLHGLSAGVEDFKPGTSFSGNWV